MTHYDQLGIKPDATEAEIKKAYRARARAKHPDKGGTAEEFAPVAKAYEVLSDPERRLLYDATGKDQRTPIKKEVEQILLHLFNEALAQDADIAVLKYVRHKVETGKSRITQGLKEIETRRSKIAAKRDKIKTTHETNYAHMVIDGELRGLDAQEAELNHQEEVRKAVLATLDGYEEDWQAPPAPAYTLMDFRRPFVTDSLWHPESGK
jgi:curved DNA-binding protein CbpA